MNNFETKLSPIKQSQSTLLTLDGRWLLRLSNTQAMTTTKCIPFCVAMEAVSIERANAVASGTVDHGCDNCVPCIQGNAHTRVPLQERTTNHRGSKVVRQWYRVGVGVKFNQCWRRGIIVCSGVARNYESLMRWMVWEITQHSLWDGATE